MTCDAKRVGINSPFWPIILLFLSMLSIQGSSSLAKSLFPILGPLAMTAWRLLFSTIILIVIFRPWRKKISKQAYFPIVIYGIILGTMNLSFYFAIQRIPIGVTVAIELIGPMTLAIITSRRIWDFVWLGLAIIGLSLLLPLYQFSSALDPIGIFLAVVAGICWALYIIFGKKAGTLHGPSSVALGSIIATLFIFPLATIYSMDTLFTFSILPLAIVVALLASVVPYALDMIALPYLSTKTFSMLMSFSPVLASLAGFAFLNEILTTTQWIAVICVVIASVGIVLSAGKE